MKFLPESFHKTAADAEKLVLHLPFGLIGLRHLNVFELEPTDGRLQCTAASWRHQAERQSPRDRFACIAACGPAAGVDARRLAGGKETIELFFDVILGGLHRHAELLHEEAAGGVEG